MVMGEQFVVDVDVSTYPSRNRHRPRRLGELGADRLKANVDHDSIRKGELHLSLDASARRRAREVAASAERRHAAELTPHCSDGCDAAPCYCRRAVMLFIYFFHCFFCVTIFS